MPLPPLTDWEPTRDSLHRAAQILGHLRKSRVAKQPNALHLALYVTTHGLETGPLDDGASASLRFAERRIQIRTAHGDAFSVSLDGQTPRTVISDAALELGLDPSLLTLPDTVDAPFEIDPVVAADYASSLNAVYTGLARWRARLLGMMTPLVVWPHGFDLSGLWFAGASADEAHEPHVNLGFSPGSAGFPRPYLYAYAWPWPEGVESRPLPGDAHWYNGGWKGAVLDYDALCQVPDPARTITEFAGIAFRALTGFEPQ